MKIAKQNYYYKTKFTNIYQYSQIKLIPVKINKFNVYLNLGFPTRFIGELDTTGDGTFTCSRKEGLHLFRKTNSLGLNYELLTNKNIPFKWIVVKYTKSDGSFSNLVTSRDYFLHYGKCFKFDSKGFELQCFLPIEEFGIHKAREFEARKSSQLNLFSEVKNE